MTLLLAPFDVVRRPSTATWKPDGSRRRSGKLPDQRRQGSGIVAGNFVWVWTVLAAVFAITLPALLNKASVFLRATVDHEKDKPANETAQNILCDVRYTMEASRVFALAKNPLAPISLSYHADILNSGKSLLGDEKVLLRDALQPATLQLEHALQFTVADLRTAENLTSVGNKAKRKNARLARVTVYWPEEGDFYTRNRKSSTGTRLRDGHCSVDPKVIPYGSVVNVPGVGRLTAVDTGGAVISRRAARLTGRTREQRSAIVVDVFCSTRAKAQALIRRVKHFAVITWQRPDQLAQL